MSPWLRRWVIGLLLSACLLPASKAQGTDPTQVVRTAYRDGKALSTQSVTLPDTLPRSLLEEDVRLVYRWRVPAESVEQGTRSLWVFRVGAPYRIHIDGQPARPQMPTPGVPDTEAVFNGRGPVLFALPQAAADVELEPLASSFPPCCSSI